MQICPRCGNKINEGTNFCPICGFDFNSMKAKSFVPPNCYNNQQQSQFGNNQTINNNYTGYRPYENFNHQPYYNQQPQKTPWWKDAITGLCLLFTPTVIIGIILMWVWKIPKSKPFRVIATILFSVVFIFGISSCTARSNNDNTAENNSPSNNVQENSTPFSFQPMTLYDQDGVQISLTGYNEEHNNPSFDMTITNSSSISYDITDFLASINGTMVGVKLDAFSVSAGNTMNTKVQFTNESLSDITDGTYYNYTFELFLDDSQTQSSIDTLQQVVTVRDGEITHNETSLYEDDDITVSLISASDNHKSNKIRIKNKTNDNMNVGPSKEAINGTMCDCTFTSNQGFNNYIYIYRAYVGVMPGNDVIVTLNADDQSLSDNNISDITSFEFYVEPIPYGSVVISTDESHGPIQLIQ